MRWIFATKLRYSAAVTCADGHGWPRRTRLHASDLLYARTLAATGPAYEAIQNVGEVVFHRAAVEQARGQLRDGLPLRAEISVVGYLACKPE
jgi:hypothetical protein